MKKRFIFDLDHTLILTDYSAEHIFFNELFPNNNFDSFISKYLNEYENMRIKYEVEDLCKFLTDRSGCLFTKKIIDDWQYFSFNYKEQVVDGVIELFTLLKKNNKEIVVLTNWFTRCQEDRLERCGLLRYIDKVYGGDIYLKPQKKAFLTACGKYPVKDCIMIGDTYSKDIIGAKSVGMDALLFNDKEKVNYKYKINHISEVSKWM